jgi:hypothetical protein
VSRLDVVAINLFPPKLAVDRVKVESMPAGNQRQSFGRIGAQLVGSAGFARLIARCDDAATQLASTLLKAAYVIALPTLQRDWDFGELLEDSVGVYAERRIALLSQPIRLFDIF